MNEATATIFSFSRPTDTERREFYKIVGAVWLIVTLYAVLHDQYIVRFAPRHFTVCHGPIWGFHQAETLAVIWAVLASVSPGVILGTLVAIAARVGSAPKYHVRQIISPVLGVVALTECIAALSGLVVFLDGKGIYPTSFYPDRTLPLLITQTIQLTCYFTAAVLSLILLARLALSRLKLRPPTAIRA